MCLLFNLNALINITTLVSINSSPPRFPYSLFAWSELLLYERRCTVPDSPAVTRNADWQRRVVIEPSRWRRQMVICGGVVVESVSWCQCVMVVQFVTVSKNSRLFQILFSYKPFFEQKNSEKTQKNISKNCTHIKKYPLSHLII